MLEAEPDDAMTADLEKELRALEKEIGRRQIDLLFNDPYTDHVALIGIHAGAGGTDSQDWAQMLLRMYLLWAEEHRMPVEFLEESVGDPIELRSGRSYFVTVVWRVSFFDRGQMGPEPFVSFGASS